MITKLKPSTENAILSDTHRHILAIESGISEAIIQARGYRTITDAAELRELGFTPAQCRPPGLLLPLWTTDGQNGCYIFRPDNPRVAEDRKGGKLPDGTYKQRVIKYEQPKGESVRVDCPPACQPQLADPTVPLFITEGQKKADALASREACAIALTGVWNFKGRNEFGGTTFLADFDHIALDGRLVYLVFDSDVLTKPPVRQAMDRFTEHLKRKGADVQVVYLPPVDGRKMGVDDWLVATGGGIPELVALAEGPRPEPKAAPPVVELLDDAPPMMSRPLALIDGRAYVATWSFVRVTVKESKTKQGEIVRHDPPIEQTERRPFIVRGDGVIFGEGGHQPLSQMGVDVRLPEMPPAEKLLSTPALKRYAAGYRPDPVDVLVRVMAVVDRFIDFDRSIADQSVMAQFIACYSMATWFLPAFSVTGYLWPNGDRGSGKTHLLNVVAELAYGGRVILAGSSFATLRDEADYGFTLAFDDAENLSDPRKTDPDKRTLLLAGNRRGNTVALKEKRGDEWVTRYVNTFSFRLFSAIRLPDSVLASRSIVVPLIRTPDRYRANADPLDYALWPHDRRQLVDDLWLLALAHLPQMAGHEAAVNRESALTGRNLEPWRALLAVARWLDEAGMSGLWERMEKLSVAYQAERPNVEMSDLTALAIRALGKVIGSKIMKEGEVSEVSEVSEVYRVKQFILTAELTTAAQAIINDSELDIDADHVNSRRIGRVLGKMRLTKARQPQSGKSGWMVSLADLARWALSYGLDLAELTGLVFSSHQQNFTNSFNFTNFTGDSPGLREGVI
jgi:hypothetical protein